MTETASLLSQSALTHIERILTAQPEYFSKMTGAMSMVPAVTFLFFAGICVLSVYVLKRPLRSARGLSNLFLFSGVVILGWFQGCGQSGPVGSAPSNTQYIDTHQPVTYLGVDGLSVSVETYVGHSIQIDWPTASLERTYFAPSPTMWSVNESCAVPDFSLPIPTSMYQITSAGQLETSSDVAGCALFVFKDHIPIKVMFYDSALLAEKAQRKIDLRGGASWNTIQLNTLAVELQTELRLPSGSLKIKISDQDSKVALIQYSEEVQKIGVSLNPPSSDLNFLKSLELSYSKIPELKVVPKPPTEQIIQNFNNEIGSQFALTSPVEFPEMSLQEAIGAQKAEVWVGWEPSRINLLKFLWWYSSPVLDFGRLGSPQAGLPPLIEERPQDPLTPLLKASMRFEGSTGNNLTPKLGLLLEPSQIASLSILGNYVDVLASFFKSGLKYGQSTNIVQFHGPVVKNADRTWMGLINVDAVYAQKILKQFRDAYELIRSPVNGSSMAGSINPAQSSALNIRKRLALYTQKYLHRTIDTQCVGGVDPGLAVTSKFARGRYRRPLTTDLVLGGQISDYLTVSQQVLGQAPCQVPSTASPLADFSWMTNFDNFVRAQAMPGGSVTFFFNVNEKKKINSQDISIRPFDAFWILYLMTKFSEDVFDADKSLARTLENTGMNFFKGGKGEENYSVTYYSGYRSVGHNDSMSERSILPDTQGANYSLAEYFAKIRRVSLMTHNFRDAGPSYYKPDATSLMLSAQYPYGIPEIDAPSTTQRLGRYKRYGVKESTDFSINAQSKEIWTLQNNQILKVALKTIDNCRFAELSSVLRPNGCYGLDEGYIDAGYNEKLKIDCNSAYHLFDTVFYDFLPDFIDNTPTQPNHKWLDQFKIRYWNNPAEDLSCLNLCQAGQSGHATPQYDWYALLGGGTVPQFNELDTIATLRTTQMQRLFADGQNDSNLSAVLDYLSLVKPLLTDGIAPPPPPSGGDSTSTFLTQNSSSSSSQGRPGRVVLNGGHGIIPVDPTQPPPGVCNLTIDPNCDGVPDIDPATINNGVPRFNNAIFAMSSNIYSDIPSDLYPAAVGSGFDWFKDFYGGPIPVFEGFESANGAPISGVATCTVDQVYEGLQYCTSAYFTEPGQGVCAPWWFSTVTPDPVGRTCAPCPRQGCLCYADPTSCPNTEPCPTPENPNQICSCYDPPDYPPYIESDCGRNPSGHGPTVRPYDSAAYDALPLLWMNQKFDALIYNTTMARQITQKFQLTDPDSGEFKGFEVMKILGPRGDSGAQPSYITDTNKIHPIFKLLGALPFQVISNSPYLLEKNFNPEEAPWILPELNYSWDSRGKFTWSYLSAAAGEPEWYFDNATKHTNRVASRVEAKGNILRSNGSGEAFFMGSDYQILAGYKRTGTQTVCGGDGDFLGVMASENSANIIKTLPAMNNIESLGVETASRTFFDGLESLQRGNKMVSDPPIGSQLTYLQGTEFHDFPYVYPEVPFPFTKNGQNCSGSSGDSVCAIPSDPPSPPDPCDEGQGCNFPTPTPECFRWAGRCCGKPSEFERPECGSPPAGCHCIMPICPPPAPSCGSSPSSSVPTGTVAMDANRNLLYLMANIEGSSLRYSRNGNMNAAFPDTTVNSSNTISIILKNYDTAEPPVTPTSACGTWKSACCVNGAYAATTTDPETAEIILNEACREAGEAPSSCSCAPQPTYAPIKISQSTPFSFGSTTDFSIAQSLVDASTNQTLPVEAGSYLLYPGKSAKFGVRFRPLSSGPKSTMVSVNINSPAYENQFRLKVSGSGVTSNQNLDTNGFFVTDLNGYSIPFRNPPFVLDILRPVVGTTYNLPFAIFAPAGTSLTSTPPVLVTSLTGESTAFSISRQPAVTPTAPHTMTDPMPYFTVQIQFPSLGEKTAKVSIANSKMGVNPFEFILKGTGVNAGSPGAGILQPNPPPIRGPGNCAPGMSQYCHGNSGPGGNDPIMPVFIIPTIVGGIDICSGIFAQDFWWLCAGISGTGGGGNQ